MTAPVLAEKPTVETKQRPKFKYYRLAVWEVVVPIATGINLGFATIPSLDSLKGHLALFHLVLRLFSEIYRLSPYHFIVFALYQITGSFEGGLILYLNSRLIDLVCTHDQFDHFSNFYGTYFRYQKN